MILQHSLEKHSVVLKAVHVNCLAAGYQFVGLYSEAENVFEFLEGRGGGDVGDVGGRNHHDDHKNANANTSTHKMEEKNEGSYSILVKNAVTQGDWSSAIDNLREMTDRGHYPKARSLNAWSETANKRERRPRRTAWIKKRERMLMKSALYDGESLGL
jgi:pentatricopeptide repeat protein